MLSNYGPLFEREVKEEHDIVCLQFVLCNFMRFFQDAKTLPFQRNSKPVPQLGVFGPSLYKVCHNPKRKKKNERDITGD